MPRKRDVNLSHCGNASSRMWSPFGWVRNGVLARRETPRQGIRCLLTPDQIFPAAKCGVKSEWLKRKPPPEWAAAELRQRIIYRLSGGVCACRPVICHKCRVVCARFSGGEKYRRKRTEKQPGHGENETNAAFFRRMQQPFVQSRNIRPRDNCQQDKRNPIEPSYMTPCEQRKRRKNGQHAE